MELVDVKMTYGEVFLILLGYIILTQFVYYIIYKYKRYTQHKKSYRTIYLYNWNFFDYMLVFGTLYLIIGFIWSLIMNRNVLL